MDFILSSRASKNLTREKFTSRIIKWLRITINENKIKLNKRDSRKLLIDNFGDID